MIHVKLIEHALGTSDYGAWASRDTLDLFSSPAVSYVKIGPDLQNAVELACHAVQREDGNGSRQAPKRRSHRS